MATEQTPPDMAARKRAAVRTALILAAVAVAIYAWGILSRI